MTVVVAVIVVAVTAAVVLTLAGRSSGHLVAVHCTRGAGFARSHAHTVACTPKAARDAKE